MHPFAMMVVSCHWLFAVAFAVAAAGAGTAPPLVQTTEGRVVGTRIPGESQQFLALPFAAPPTGELRWRPPRPPQRWSGTRDATAARGFAPACSQTEFEPSAEDCLYLNVWAPLPPAGGPPAGGSLAVMLFFHGGGWTTGATEQRVLNASRLVALSGRVLVVTAAYRLGVMGYLGSQAMLNESGTAGNWGELDKIAAMEWVQRNAKSFGADPARAAPGVGIAF